MRIYEDPERWCLHGYYTLSPFCPDGSGRVLAASANLAANTGAVVIFDGEGRVLDRFGEAPVESAFYHTGRWQTWSPDGREVRFQGGTLKNPQICYHHLETGITESYPGDMEGAPPDGGPILTGLMGMLYAAGYGGTGYRPEEAPAPFQARDRHGVFEFDRERSALRLSVAEILERHPDRDALHIMDNAVRERLGPGEGLTLMAYCVRWSRDGSKLLFYFGNHCTDSRRGEPRISYILTSDRKLTDFHVAVNLSERSGGHWSWQPDGEHLIGYAPPAPGEPPFICEVGAHGGPLRLCVPHCGGGHPSVSPSDPDLVVTDEPTPQGGRVLFFRRGQDNPVREVALKKFHGESEDSARNPHRVCHHPVFHPDGSRVLFNFLDGPYSRLGEIIM